MVYPEDIPKYFKQLRCIEALILTLYYYWGLDEHEIYQELLGTEHEWPEYFICPILITAKKHLRALIASEDKELNG